VHKQDLRRHFLRVSAPVKPDCRMSGAAAMRYYQQYVADRDLAPAKRRCKWV